MPRGEHELTKGTQSARDRQSARARESSARVTEVLVARAQAELADLELAYNARLMERSRERAAKERKSLWDRPPTPESEAWMRRARGLVRRAGHSRGAARDTLIELFAGQDCASSVSEVEELLEMRQRPVGRASIYRALEVLSDLGLLVRVDFGDGAARYERAHDHDDEHHHHHMICDTCGVLIPFDDADLEQAIDSASVRLGFDTKGHDVTLRGTCEECRLGAPD